MIAEPCCMHKVVHALHEAPNRVLTFHSYGDVSFGKFYQGIACLITEPHVMVLTMCDIDIPTADYLRHCFDRGWITDLVLTTSKDCSALVQTTLKEYLYYVSYTQSSYVCETSGQMVLYTSPAVATQNPQQTLILNGFIPNSKCKKGNLCTYTLIFQPRVPAEYHGVCGDHLTNALRLLSVLHNQKKGVVRGSSETLEKFCNGLYIEK